ncbi:MAG: adenylosuccinate synthase [Bacilli bacterium]|nr:adenylosuccinate synthase [Bacilli bacterium]
MSKSLIVLGSQWGDEGKGKITNYYSERADVVVRYQGGNNAGHTIVFGGNTFKLRTIPSGVFNKNIKNILGNGMVINPKSLVKEMQVLIDAGYDCRNIYISDRAQVLFDYHVELDKINEEKLQDNKIGTTKNGIGPCYSDKVNRIGIRMGDFVSEDFKEIYKLRLQEKNVLIKEAGHDEINFEESYKEYQEIADQLRPFVCDTIELLYQERTKGHKILFEGAQGALLDVDFGSYPYVTSSNPSSGGALIGSGIGMNHIEEAVGIVKAYTTRVGSGAFPTEFEDEVAHYIREKAHEYGTVTKRPRRIGWLDLVALKYSANINGLTGIFLTLIDILSTLKEIKVCVSYNLKGKDITYVPARDKDLEEVKPNVVTLKGWDEDLSKVTKYEELPENAKAYIKFIEDYTNIPVIGFSVGPDKFQTIIRKDIF